MTKVQQAALVLAVVGIYSFTQGRKTADVASILQTWLPLAGAAYFAFMA